MLRAAGINFKTFLRLPAFCSRGHLTINYSAGPRVKYIALIQGQSIYPLAFVLSVSLARVLFSSIRLDSNYCSHPLTRSSFSAPAKGFSANHQSGSEIEFHSMLSPLSEDCWVCPGICYHKLCSHAISSPRVFAHRL